MAERLLLCLSLVLALTVPDVVYGSTEDGSVREAQEDNQCPDWLNPNNTQPCQCVSEVLHCNSSTQEVAILDCYCMTASESNDIEIGGCIFNCEHSKSAFDMVYKMLPKNISGLTSWFCDDFNRQGRLCGECKDDYYPPSYSYSLKCIKCKGHYWYWLIYITAAFVPLTIFFILVVCLRISATSPQLNGYVVVAQTLTVPANLRIVLLTLEGRKTSTLFVGILTSLYGIWNLDFFRTLIPGICLHVNTLEALALDYVIAVYPLVLTIICYVAIQLHLTDISNSSRFIAYLLMPFNACFNRIRDQIDARTSLIDAFATFLLLSYVRLCSVSFDLLVPTQVFNATGHKIGLYLYYDASIEYFGKQHLPYAITALAVVLVFILLPLLLLMAFPMRCFQRRLEKYNLESQVLRTFMDSFQGCYKDGTGGTRDFRYCPAVYMSLRIFLFTMYAVTLNVAFYDIAALSLMILAAVIIVIQPYKEHLSMYNAVEAIHFMTLAMWFVSAVSINAVSTKSIKLVDGFLAFSIIVSTLPIFYISFVALKWIFTREKVQKKLNKYLQCYKRSQYQELQGNDSFIDEVDQRNVVIQ